MSDNNEKKYHYILVVKSPTDPTQQQIDKFKEAYSGSDIIVNWVASSDFTLSLELWTNDPEMKMHKLS